MKLQPAADFLKWASSRHIAIDAEYAHDWPRNLTFTTPAPDRRFWDYPDEARDAAYFLPDAPLAVGDWSHIAIWPKSPHWIDEITQAGSFEHSTRQPLADALLAPFGPYGGEPGAIVLDRSELREAVAAMFASLTFGGFAHADLFLIPDDGEVFFMTDHHHVLWAKFAATDRCLQYVAEMLKRGWPLPASPPDETFKHQPWLNPPSKP